MGDKPTVYGKIIKVMEEIEYLQKDDNISMGYGKPSYKGITEEKVTSSVRSALIKHQLCILPVKQETTVDKDEVIVKGNVQIKRLTQVNTTYRIVDAETGDFIDVVSTGTGVDTQDKGVGKAMTYAYKYMILRSFAIPTGEDPDKISSKELDDELQPKQPTPKNQKPKQQTNKPKTKQENENLVWGLILEVSGNDENQAHDLLLSLCTQAGFEYNGMNKISNEKLRELYALASKYKKDKVPTNTNQLN